MKTRPLSAAAALVVLFGVNEASATTYTIDVDYNLLNGTICPSNICGATVFLQTQPFPVSPVSLPTLHAGDVIDTTINFTQGLALTINASSLDRQEFGVQFSANNSATAQTLTFSQLTLLHVHGDLLNPPVLGPGSGHSSCQGGCVAGAVAGHFTDGSFSFRGMEIVTTILSISQPFGSDDMNFFAFTETGDIEITHGASENPVVPLPATLPLFATGLGVLGLLGWRRKRKAQAAA